MSQALTTISSLITRTSSLTVSKPNKTPTPCLDVRMISLPPKISVSVEAPTGLSPVPRRNAIVLGIAVGIAGAFCGLNVCENAWAAARRPPPQQVEKEKKDPNVSGVLAKVLASKKRKEAMKQQMAMQRERGKKVDDSSTSSPPSQESSPS
ncbi:hypothetical protein SOVF_187540 [Spinacia oleracea]|nr:hypothetical protein SOVF_187540 [Spinacia oleracea]